MDDILQVAVPEGGIDDVLHLILFVLVVIADA